MLTRDTTGTDPKAPRPGAPQRTLVLGVGNPLRSDDGVGWMVAQHLTQLGGRPRGRPDREGFEVQTLRGDATELVEAWREAETVVLIDAGISGSAPGTIHRFDAIREGLPAHWEHATTHGLGVAMAVELARTLDALPRRLTVFVIEGENFAPGGELTAAVRQAAHRLIERLEERGAE